MDRERFVMVLTWSPMKLERRIGKGKTWMEKVGYGAHLESNEVGGKNRKREEMDGKRLVMVLTWSPMKLEGRIEMGKIWVEKGW